MNDRPEDHSDPETSERQVPGGQGPSGGRQEVPPDGTPPPQPPEGGGGQWWHPSRPDSPAWGEAGTWPPQGGWHQDPYSPGGPGAPGGPGGPGAPGGPGWQGGPWGWAAAGPGWGYQHQVQPPTDSRPRRRGLAAVVVTAFTVLALLVGVGIGYDVWDVGGASTPSSSFLPGGGTARPTFSTAPGGTTRTSGTKVSSATGAPSGIATVRAKVSPALVDINTVLGYETDEAAGTGMVLTPTGKILTNNHVIEEATKISATDLGNGKTYSATVLGYTRTNDVAVIQLVGASHLKTVDLGNSATVKVGEAIVGIGNAGGTGGVPSAAGGSVTALDQSIKASDEGSFGTTYEQLTGLIESNADIRPGDSGGPLVTTSGVVVGMDTAASVSEGYSFQGSTTGRGYSIPINEAMSVAHQIIARKASPSVHIGGTAFLGVYVVASETGTSSGTPFRHFGFGGGTPFTSGTRTSTSTSTGRSAAPVSGAVVHQVIPGTPAQSSGLAATDVITSIDGKAVASPTALTKVLLGYHPGDSVKVGWTTSTGQTASAKITLGSGPPE